MSFNDNVRTVAGELAGRTAGEAIGRALAETGWSHQSLVLPASPPHVPMSLTDREDTISHRSKCHDERWGARSTTIIHWSDGGTSCDGRGAVKPAAAGGGSPQGQASRRLVRRRESEPTDDVVQPVW